MQIAYAAADGSPRAVPLGYLLREGKFLFFTIPTSDKVAALHRDPRIALTIDAYPPPCCLLVRGTAELREEDGVPEEYLEASFRTMPEEQHAGFEQQVAIRRGDGDAAGGHGLASLRRPRVGVGVDRALEARVEVGQWELALVEAVRSLPEREARIIEMRHGLDGSETLTLREVSEELGISQERARQVEIKALRTIRTGRYASTLRRALSEAV